MSPGRNPDTKTIGVAGCGAMGLPMARRLLGAGVDVLGFDIRPISDFGDFAPRMITDPGAFAARCPTVISVVRDWAQTRALCFDDQALFARDHRPATFVVASTLSPRRVADLARELPAGTGLVDAPMSGAPYGAEAGTLTFMVGGEDAAIQALMPLFHIMGAEVHHLGPTGAGMTCKVLNNFVAATSVVAVRRVLADARKLGLDPARLRRVMATSSGGTWYGDNFEHISWAAEGYAPDNTIGILEKDVQAFQDALNLSDGTLEESVLDGLRLLEPWEELKED